MSAGTAHAATPPLPRELAPILVSMLVDIGSGQVLEARAPDRRFLPASVTKVMTMYVAAREIAAGRLARNRVFTVSGPVARVWGHRVTGLYLRTGQTISAEALLHGIATVSANDAAEALAEGYAGSVPAWCAMMNRTARQLGMTRSSFASPNGWPDGGQTQVTARDLVALASALIREHPHFYHHFFGQKSMTWEGFTQHNHDPITGVVPGADGIKTGHTGEAGFTFLGSAERNGRRLVMVIGGAQSGEQRAAAARTLMEWGFAAWRTRPLLARGAIVGRAKVQGGTIKALPLVARGPVYAAIPRGTSQPVRLTLRYRGPLIAPIAQGAQVASLSIDVLGQPAASVPLFAARAVPRASALRIMLNGVLGWL